MWATPDPQFAMAQCRVCNNWAWEQFGTHQDRMLPAGALATGDLEARSPRCSGWPSSASSALTLPCKPIWGGHDSEQ